MLKDKLANVEWSENERKYTHKFQIFLWYYYSLPKYSSELDKRNKRLSLVIAFPRSFNLNFSFFLLLVLHQVCCEPQPATVEIPFSFLFLFFFFLSDHRGTRFRFISMKPSWLEALQFFFFFYDESRFLVLRARRTRSLCLCFGRRTLSFLGQCHNSLRNRSFSR